MQFYAQFLHDDGREAIGDRGIIRLDGRLSLFNMETVAFDTMRQRGFKDFVILRGEHLLDAKPMTKMFYKEDLINFYNRGA